MKKIISVVLALVMMSALCVCSASAEAPKSWRDYDLSGEITIYTTQTEQQTSLIEDAFAEAYPDVTLNFVNDNTGTLITRLDAESANVQADAFFGALGELDGDKYHQYFEKYDNIYLDECFKKDPAGIYNYFTIAVNCLMVNTEITDELGIEINSITDLFQPELVGKIGNMNPNTSSSSFRNLVTFLSYGGNGDLMSDAAWEYVEKLIVGMDGQYGTNLPTAVDGGEWAVAVFYEDSSLANEHDGMNFHTVYPTDCNIGVFIGSAVVKNCPNPDGAHAVVDYICSAEYQTKLMEETEAFRPANSTVTYEIEGMPAYDDLPLVAWEAQDVIDNTQAIYDKWTEIWAAHFGA